MFAFKKPQEFSKETGLTFTPEILHLIALSKFNIPPLKIMHKQSNYVVKVSESGSIITTKGASAPVSFTLPDHRKKWSFLFINSEDQNMVVYANESDVLVTKNDMAADAVGYMTRSEKIGGVIWAFSDGWSPHALGLGNNLLTVIS